MDSGCDCVPENTPVEVSQPILIDESPVIDVNFGKVPFTGRRDKEILVDLNDKVVGSFRIESKNHSKHKLFNIKPSQGFCKGTKVKLLGVYFPNVPFQKDFEEFHLLGEHYCITLSLQGESIGPVLTTSSNEVLFIQEPRHKSGRSVIEITNHTNIPAPFSIEIDHKQKLFSVTPTSGVCSNLTFIVIKFNPPDEYGAYSQQLNFLPFGCQPIVIQLIGYFGPKLLNPKDISIIHYPFSFENRSGYKGCFRYKIKDENVKMPVVLSTHYIDLGRAKAKEMYEDHSTVVTKNFYITNNLDNEIYVYWLEDDKVFNIFPRRVCIMPGASMVFKSFFRPIYPEICYNRMFTAQVYWKPHNFDKLPINDDYIIVPLTLSITLQGHSYKEGQIPLTNVEFVPKVLEFPISLPGESVYQNFKIVNKLSKPVIFKLVPSCKSDILITPDAGIIKDFTVLLVNIKSVPKDRPIDEFWQLILNSQPKSTIDIRIRAIAKEPSVRIDTEDKIYFKNIQMQTYATKTVWFSNISDFNLRYWIIQPQHNFLTFTPAEGVIYMHKKIPITVTFKADECSPKVMNVTIRLHVQQNINELVGPCYEHTFSVYTDILYSQLTATPLKDVFDVVEYGTIIKSSFHLYNFGHSTVFFKVNAILTGDTLQMDPALGALEPQESTEINVVLECKTFGDNVGNIEYYNRFDINSEEHGKVAIPLIQFTYKCEISILKIQEIVEHTFGPLFSKLHFWHFLKIERVNQIFKTIRREQTETIKVDLPECLEGSCHYVTLLIENTTEVNTELKLRRLKLCKCVHKQKHEKYRIQYFLDCYHRNTLNMEMTNSEINVKAKEKLTITVAYLIPGPNLMAYEVYIRPHRTIIFYFNFYTIPTNVPRISSFSNTFSITMLNGILSARNPSAQIFWFYNNSNFLSNIFIDLTELDKLNEEQKFPIFECLYSDNFVKPKGIWPLMIKFRPIELIHYSVNVYINMNNETRVLEIEGTGVLKPNIVEVDAMPRMCTTTYRFPIKLSKNNLFFKCLPTWNFAETIIFIENISQTRMMYYEWTDVYIENIIKITVQERVGILRPGKMRSVKVLVETFNESLLTTFTISCSAMDLQLMYVNKRMEAVYEQLKLQEEDEFEFSDYAIKQTNPVNLVDETQTALLSKQLNFNLSLSVAVNVVDKRDLHIFLPNRNDIFKLNLHSFDVEKKCNFEGAFVSTLDVTNKGAKHENNALKLIEQVLENMVTDVVFDDIFPEIAYIIFYSNPPYYPQLKFYIDKRASRNHLENMKENEIKKFFSRPEVPLVAGTIKNFIQDTVTRVFNLTPVSEELEDEQAIKDTLDHFSNICTVKECECPAHKI